jgi:hypothetical protein
VSSEITPCDADHIGPFLADGRRVCEVGPGQFKPGDRIRFTPSGSSGNRWWTVLDADRRFVVATQQAPFKPKGEIWYTVVDLTGWQEKRYNGAGNGIVRSSLNTLGGGWDCETDEGIAAIIPALHSGEWELSHRRVASVWSIEVAS